MDGAPAGVAGAVSYVDAPIVVDSPSVEEGPDMLRSPSPSPEVATLP